MSCICTAKRESNLFPCGEIYLFLLVYDFTSSLDKYFKENDYKLFGKILSFTVREVTWRAT